MKSFLDKLCSYTELIGGVLFGLMAAVVFIQVIIRYLLDYSLAWTGELATFLFVWVTMLGAAIATHRISHISVTALNNAVSEKKALILSMIAQILMLIVSVIICATGFSFAVKNINNISVALHVPFVIPMLSLFIGALLMVVFGLGVIWRLQVVRKGDNS